MTIPISNYKFVKSISRLLQDIKAQTGKRIMIRRVAQKKWEKRIKMIRQVTILDRDANGRYGSSRTSEIGSAMSKIHHTYWNKGK
ncbi:19087_t:CDS:2 [Funneliformis geosporum]|nr:19087_t:CDS:2 [Funneliformis geosporum]